MIHAAQDDISLLLGVLARLAVDRGGRLTKIRLVKFLYLLDVYWAQAQRGTYTSWQWAFVHYGPYCRESTDAIDRAAESGFLSPQTYESSYSDEDYRLYSPGNRITEADVDKVMGSLPPHVYALLTSAVKRWYDDTHGLLDYVYFRTGPMERARPGEVLSFANEKMPDLEALRPVRMNPLSIKKKAALREAIKKISQEAKVYRQAPELFDKEYFDFIAQVAGSETETGTTGTAKLNFDAPTDD
jgi:hypothetical protein